MQRVCKVFLCTNTPVFDYARPDEPAQLYCEEHAEELGLSASGQSLPDDGVQINTEDAIESDREKVFAADPTVAPPTPAFRKAPAPRPAAISYQQAPKPKPKPSQRSPQQTPPPAARPAVFKSPEPGEPMSTRTGKPVEELDASGAVIGSWPSAAAAEHANKFPLNCLGAAIRKKGEYRNRRFRFSGGAAAASPAAKKTRAPYKKRAATTPPPPHPSSSPPLAARAITAAAPMMILPNSAHLGDEGILAPLAQGIVNLAMRNGGIQNLNLSLQAGGVDVQISVASFKCSITPVEGDESK